MLRPAVTVQAQIWMLSRMSVTVSSGVPDSDARQMQMQLRGLYQTSS